MTTQFYTAISSLPRIGASFKISEPPILRLQLEKRLKMIPEEQMNLLFAIELVAWSTWFKSKQSVAETRALYQYVMKADSVFINNVVDWYLDVRSVLAAMRMRNSQKGPPPNPKDHWITRWEHQFIQHWDLPDFGLKAVYPWIPTISAYMVKGDSASIEELLLTTLWQHLSRIEAEHFFDFEALIIYVLRWNIVNYWSRYRNANVLERLDELCNSLEQMDKLIAV